MGQKINLASASIMHANLSGKDIVHQKKRLSDLRGMFDDVVAFEKMNGDQVIYEVDALLPVQNDTIGGLFFGITHLHPGNVGDEYFMTKGHFHAVENRAEFYWGIEGEGLLLLMNKNRYTWAEMMSPGSLHYIPGFTAHRVVNTGNKVLAFGACWPSDAGYNYESIATEGFSRRVKKSNKNIPVLV
jgi:glucose-6-phosphate isomerase